MANEVRDAVLAALRHYERRDRSSGNPRIRGRVAAQAQAAQDLADSLAVAARAQERQAVVAELAARAATVRGSGRANAAAIADELAAAAQDVGAEPGTVDTQPGRGAGRG